MVAVAGLLADARDLLRCQGAHAAGAEASVPWQRLALLSAVASAGYGAVMGLYEPRPLQILYSALKVPLLLGVATGLCLANFFVVNSVLGLRADFSAALRGILSSQGTLAVCLLSLAPLTALIYLSGISYAGAKVSNGLMFALASVGGQLTLLRHYRRLIAKDRAHRLVLIGWFVLYAFVAIQFSWILRPFIGAPELETSFFRADAWGNAYVEVLRALGGWLRGAPD